MTVELTRGDVVLVRLDSREGREIRKTRPAVVISNQAACRLDAVVQVVPVTSLPERSPRPYESPVGAGTSGLAKPSRAVANQLRTVARHRVVERLGSLDPAELAALERAVSIQLGLRREP